MMQQMFLSGQVEGQSTADQMRVGLILKGCIQIQNAMSVIQRNESIDYCELHCMSHKDSRTISFAWISKNSRIGCDDM